MVIIIIYYDHMLRLFQKKKYINIKKIYDIYFFIKKNVYEHDQ